MTKTKQTSKTIDREQLAIYLDQFRTWCAEADDDGDLDLIYLERQIETGYHDSGTEFIMLLVKDYEKNNKQQRVFNDR